ncbi:hypothetical protein JCM10207_006481 [Rhodosporidiobolus poonsookiae]
MSSTCTHAATASSSRVKRERQTRLQEHLKAVKPSRGLSPAAKKPIAHQPVEPAASSSRPRRKAAAKVVMQEMNWDSDDEDEQDEPSAGEEESQDTGAEEQARSKRGSKRLPTAPRRSASVEDLAPAVKPLPTPARKSPAKPAQRPTPRQREISSLSIDVDGMSEIEIQQQLQREKNELMNRLAQHGILPQADVLDRALRTMSDSNEKLSVDSFLRTLSSLDTNVSPVHRGGLPLPPLALQVSPPSQPKKVSFSTLESPSTPTTAEEPAFRFPSPPHSAYSAAPTNLLPSALPVPPTRVAPLTSPHGYHGVDPSFAAQQQQQLPNPAAIRANRLSAFANRSHSAPIVPTMNAQLPTPAPLASSSLAGPGLVATSINGMGRVALSRRTLFGAPVQPQQQQQPVLPAAHHSHMHSAPSPALLPAFPAAPSTSAPSPAHVGQVRARPAPPARAGLSRLQSWLDDGDDEDDSPEEDAASPKKQDSGDAAAELGLKAAAAASKLGASLAALPREPALQLVDAPASDDEAEPRTELRVGGKNVKQFLKSSLKRKAGEETVDRVTRSKGKGKAAVDCVCGSTADESDGARCAECDVVFHLACLNLSSQQLPPAWACERCTGVDLASASKRPSTPPLAIKRVRIGTNSTPIVDQEPTFVDSSFSPAPRRTNDFSDCADVALAPALPTSPIRPFAVAAPTSPSPSKVSIPVTPQFGEATIRAPGDYSPHSPQAYRKRARVASNGGAFSQLLNSGWDDAAHGFDATPSAHGSVFDGSDPWQAAPWSDMSVTMTPSRALASSSTATPGTGGTAFDSPFSSHARRPSLTFFGSSAHHRTPSGLGSGSGSDFLASLDAHPHHHLAHSAPPLSQRLFAGAEHDAPYSTFGGASLSSPSRSPLNPRRLPPGHRRTPSAQFGANRLGGAFGGAGGAGPWSPTPAHAMPPPSLHSRQPSSYSMQVTQSMPGLGRGGFSQAVGWDGQVLDDLAF